MSYRRPIGVVGLITPFNFPLAIPTWKMFPALLCGNSVIIKPSEDVPHTVHLLVEILLEAGPAARGHPAGARARARPSGKALVEHPEVPVISFTGSTETGAIIGETCGRMHKRLSLEMGGKNAHDRDGRRRSRSGARGRALGRVRHHGPALHRHQPAHPPPEDPRPASSPAGRAGRSAAAGRRARGRDRRGSADPRGGAREGRALRRDRPGGGRRAGHAAASAPGGAARRRAGSTGPRCSRA